MAPKTMYTAEAGYLIQFLIAMSPCSDRAALTKELAVSMKKDRVDADLKDNKKASLRGIEEKAVEIGKKARNEVGMLAATSCVCGLFRLGHGLFTDDASLNSGLIKQPSPSPSPPPIPSLAGFFFVFPSTNCQRVKHAIARSQVYCLYPLNIVHLNPVK